MTIQTAESQSDLLPEEIISILKEGNKRFVNNKLADRDLMGQVVGTSSGQFPFAVVISCIDSRVPPEIIFDLDLGDILSIRVAGNVINNDVLGSLEFACKIAGVKLIVVMGHTNCGAISGACNNVELGNLTSLLDKIKPAIEMVQQQNDTLSSEDDIQNQVARKNVSLSIDTILNGSPILREMINSNAIRCAEGMYSVETGEVELNLL